MKRTRWIAGLTTAVAAVSVLTLSLTTASRADTQRPGSPIEKPTIVLVHGAWADASGWTPVAERLEKAGYTVDAPPNPLRGLAPDSQYIASVLKQIKGPVILVGHSYGGAVITGAAAGDPNVKALVYIAAFAPDNGDSLQSLLAMPAAQTIPGLPIVPATYPKADGTEGVELTIDPGANRPQEIHVELTRRLELVRLQRCQQGWP